MTQPNTKVFSFAFVGDALYDKWKKRIKHLAEQTHTTITFDFKDQYFDITGKSTENVEWAAQQIYSGLLRKLNEDIDENMMLGTFATLASIEEAATKRLLDFASDEPESPVNTSMAGQNQQQQQNQLNKTQTGRPLELEEFDDVKTALNEIEHKIMEETEVKEEETFKAVFKFSKNINNPQEILKGIPGPNLQATDYLREVMNATETECILEGREIHIEGSDNDQVEDALQRFLNIQTLWKRGRRPATVVPCVHYPTDSPYYGLYFCHLIRYAQKSYVDLLVSDSLRPMYVLLPVFKNPETGQYQKPRNLLDAAPRPSGPHPNQDQLQRIAAPPRPSWVQHPSAPVQPTFQQQQRQQRQQQQPRRQSMPNNGRTMSPPSMPSSEGPLWGENRGFVNNYAGSSYSSTPSPPTPSPSAQTGYQQQQQPKSQDADFPALPSAPSRQSYVPVRETPGQPMQRRVVRITNQQHVHGSPEAPLSQLEMARQYNLNNIRTALTDGLESVRGFKGEIRLEAKLGKVLWTNLSSDVAKKIWEFQDIKDLVVKEHGVQPFFNNVTTAVEKNMEIISEILPRPFKHTGFFEIKCKARNQPALDYKPVTMIMNQGIVELKKVITRQQKVTEIDWVSLDRKFDFQLSLSAQELCRVDIKPYSTFIKKVSVCPITNQMTFENVRDFLKVEQILHKQKTLYRIHFPFIVEITRVESVPIKLQPNSGYGVDKVLGMTGSGQVWYDLQVFYTNHDEPFRTNMSLSAGELAPWTVEDILGPENDPQKLIEYIKCLLVLTEKCEPLFS